MTGSEEDKVLPSWGPYSKKYMGVSHIPASGRSEGARFDCVVFPTVANSGVPVPNVTVPSQYHPWKAAGDLSYFSYRYELEWKDRVYADVSFTRVDAHETLIRTEFVNRSDLAQNCLLNYFCAMEYPAPEFCRARMPEKVRQWDALDYTEYTYACPRPWDGQNPDGAKKGEFLDGRFTGGRGLGDRVNAAHVPQLHFQPFGAAEGDTAAYRVPAGEAFPDAVLGVRYRSVPGRMEKEKDSDAGRQKRDTWHSRGPQEPCVWDVTGVAHGEWTLPFSQGLTTAFFPLGRLGGEGGSLRLTARGGGSGVELDCFFIVPKAAAPAVQFETMPRRVKPEICSQDGAMAYRYPEIDETYRLSTMGGPCRCREIDTGCLEDALISRLSNADPTYDDVTEPFTASFPRKQTTPGFYHNVIVSPIFIGPGETHVEYALIADGALRGLTAEQAETLWRRAQPSDSVGLNPAGQPFEFSVRLLESTLLGNVVYPIYRHGRYIRHFTPGKRWDSLYTWDSGFIGLGLLETAPRLAEYVLETYLTGPDNPDFAFLFHGSPVPTQAYLYLELLNRSGDKSPLLALYPRLKLYYEFLAGRTHGSTTARFKSGLTTTYDLFYSSSGMDDYPAQVYMHGHGLERTAAPCICTSQLIRFAKILRMAADQTGRAQDCARYEADIRRLTAALDRWAWDEPSGYFGYVLHDENLEPAGILRTESGENLNKGFDGMYPLVAGACTPEQTRRIVGHLASREEIFSPVGLSAVDMTSRYYQPNGYWNGSVWFAHQWFFYKALLDNGQTGLAFRIADTALKAWKREVDDSYNCFEMLNIATGRGGWYHQFGGLSSPVAVWADAYYKPGTVTAGFDVWLKSRAFSADGRGAEIEFAYYGKNPRFALIVVLSQAGGAPREVRLDGEPVPFIQRRPGALEITLDGRCRHGRLTIG